MFIDDNEMKIGKDFDRTTDKRKKTSGFYFLSERLGKEKLLQQQHKSFVNFYSDNGACYYPG